MIEKPIDKITPDDLRDLATRQVTERRTLDYKRDLDFRKDADRKEFVADILSFANSAGGDIVFGMDEARDANGGKLGYPEFPVGTAPFAADDDMKRAIEQCVRDSSEPRVPALDIAIVPGFANGPVVVVRVQRSTAAPHRSLRDNAFYARATTGRYQLDVRQLRSLFVDAAAQEQVIREFVGERLRPITAHRPGTEKSTWTPPVSVDHRQRRGLLIVHAVSSSFTDRAQAIDVRTFPPPTLLQDAYPQNQHMHWVRRHNLDGVAVWQQLDAGRLSDPAISYRQLFRRGAMECVDLDVLNIYAEHTRLHGDLVEDVVIENLRTSVQTLAAAGCAFPVFAFASLAWVSGLRLYSDAPGPRARHPFAIDREHLVLPELAIMAPDVDVARELRTAFDALWQAGGWSGSPNYADDGARTTKRT